MTSRRNKNTWNQVPQFETSGPENEIFQGYASGK